MHSSIARVSSLLIASMSLLGGFCWGQKAEEDATWQRRLDAQSLREDFERLYHGLRGAHADLYVHRTKAEYDARYAQIRDSLTEPKTLFDAQVLFQQFAAYGNVAHARIEFPSEAYQAFLDKGGRQFPLYLRIHEGRAYVGENLSGVEGIRLGDEVMALNGAPIARWLQRTATHVSADTPYIAHSFLEFTFARYLWLELGQQQQFFLTLRAKPGESYTVRVPARTREAMRQASREQPERFALQSNERTARMLGDGVAYLRPGPFYNAENPNAMWDNGAYLAFIDGAFEQFLAADAERLIIDLRDNPGGDSSFSDPMLAWIADRPFRFCSAFLIRSSDEAAASNQARLDASPDATAGVSARFARDYAKTPRGERFAFEIPWANPREGARFEGEVVVLINRHSYSNAVNVAATVQDYGFAVIAGEKTSDMATTYGAMEQFTLPHTGLTVGFPKAHIIRPSGDTRVDGVTPDWEIPTPIAPTASDVVLEQLLSRMRR
ncbi:MAG: S41 family peptidase [Pseudomonadota bacterium]